MTGFFASLVVPEEAEVTDDMWARVSEALALVEATALTARNVAELSTGELRRVLIARALVHRPQALCTPVRTSERWKRGIRWWVCTTHGVICKRSAPASWCSSAPARTRSALAATRPREPFSPWAGIWG